jgi:transcription initiation factor TFIID subunit 6
MKTLLLALVSSDKNKSMQNKGTREGAIRGLIGVGKEAIRKGLVESGGAKVVATDRDGMDPTLVRAVLVSCQVQ